MNTTFKSISNNTFDCSFATSKWNDCVVFSSKVQERLDGDMEV